MQLAALLARRRGVFSCAAWLVSALALATLARAAVGALSTGLALFYLPSIIVVTLFTGWECGVIAVILSGLLGWILFFPSEPNLHLPNAAQAVSLLFWTIVAGTQVALAQFLRVALSHVLHSETRYRSLLTVASGIVCVSDSNAEIHLPQSGWTELTGVPWPEYCGRAWLKSVHPEDHSRLELETLSEEEAFREVELRLWSARSGDWRWFQARSVAVPSHSGVGTEWITSLHDIHGRKLDVDRRNMLIGELRHRLKNLLTVIEGLAKSSRDKDQPEVESFLRRFLGRLRAIGTAGDIILADRRGTIDCAALVDATLAPFVEDQAARFRIEGPQLYLSEETGSTFGLAVHEMATNALKYGALSTEGGEVAVTWSIAPQGDNDEEVAFEWKEHGGPAPQAPSSEGFGMRLIRSVPTRERNGNVRIDYPPEGFRCRITFLRARQGSTAREVIADAAQ